MRRKHHDLVAWTLSIRLVKEVYRLTCTFPNSEVYGLVSQMRRAAVSVPSNIAEGAARTTPKEFAHFLGIARGSLSELETQIVISKELGYLSDTAALDELVDRTFGLIGGLVTAIRKKS